MSTVSSGVWPNAAVFFPLHVHGRSGTLGRLGLSLLLVVLLFSPSSATCVHCNGFIPQCPGSDGCPFVVDLAANVAVFESGDLGRTPTISNLLPPALQNVFPRSVVEAIRGIATA